MPFDQYLRKHLFYPLGMNDTWFYLPPEKADRLVPVQYQNDQGEWIRYPTTFYDPDYPIKGAKTFFSGGAGLSCSAKDYANTQYFADPEEEIIGILMKQTQRHFTDNTHWKFRQLVGQCVDD